MVLTSANCFEVVFLVNNIAWMFGRTPQCAIFTPQTSLFNFLSLRIASCKLQEVIRLFCCNEQRCPQARSLWRSRTKLVNLDHQFRRFGGTCRCATDGAHYLQEIARKNLVFDLNLSFDP